MSLFDEGSVFSIYDPKKRRLAEDLVLVVGGAAVVMVGFQMLRGEVKKKR